LDLETELYSNKWRKIDKDKKGERGERCVFSREGGMLRENNGKLAGKEGKST